MRLRSQDGCLYDENGRLIGTADDQPDAPEQTEDSEATDAR